MSDGVAWEVRDVTASTDRGEARWDYTLILTERAGIPIDFEREEVGGFAGGQALRGPSGSPFTRRLSAHETLRLRLWNKLTGPSGGFTSTYMVWRRFIGKDPAGRPVQVDVRLYPRQLERAVSTPPPATGTRSPNSPPRSGPPARTADRLKELDSLRQQELITEEEYRAARNRILEGL